MGPSVKALIWGVGKLFLLFLLVFFISEQFALS
jgi:hypothetical protein